MNVKVRCVREREREREIEEREREKNFWITTEMTHAPLPWVIFFVVYVTILCASVYQCHVSAAAPDVTMLPQTQTHTRNESCEVELRLIRVTTYLQTVGGGKLPRSDSWAKRHTCTFDSGPASPNCKLNMRGRELRDGRREGGKWQGVGRIKNTPWIPNI